MDRLSHILPSMLKERTDADCLSDSSVLIKTNAWLKNHISCRAATVRAVQIVHGVLIIETDHSAFLPECTHKSPELLSHIAAVCPLSCITSVRVIRSQCLRQA